MKYLFFVLAAVLLSCTASAQGSVMIKGKVLHSDYDSIFISFNNSRLIYDPVEFKTQLDDSSFEYSFKVKELFTPVTIQHGKYFAELFVKPGDDLNMTAVVRDSSWDVSYSGTGAERANFLAKHAAEMGLVDKYPVKMQRYLTGKPESYVKNMKLEQLKEMVYLENNRKGLSDDFVAYLQACYEYFTYYCLFQYPYMHEVAKNKSFNFSSIPRENYEAVKDIPEKFNDAFIGMVPYRLYTDQIYRMRLEVDRYFNDTVDVFRVQDSIAKLALKNMPPATAEYVIALHLYAAIRHLPLDTAAAKLAAFKKRWPESQYLDNLESQFAIAKRLAPGEKAIDFTFTTPQGKTGRLSDFKGKVVLLGFWSSQYRQSIIDMRAAVQLANKYKDQDVVFLYVSLDTDDFPWIMAIEQNKLAGIHTRENGSWKSFLAQLYGIQGLPTFFLIDREGRFALKQTPNPSQSAFMVKAMDKVLAE